MPEGRGRGQSEEKAINYQQVYGGNVHTVPSALLPGTAMRSVLSGYLIFQY